jgi:hypothetical protein
MAGSLVHDGGPVLVPLELGDVVPCTAMVGAGKAENSGAIRVGAASFGQPMWVGIIMRATSLFSGYGYAFPRAVRGADLTLRLASAALWWLSTPLLGELFWRGCCIATFHDSWLVGIVFPAVGFGIRHLSHRYFIPIARTGEGYHSSPCRCDRADVGMGRVRRGLNPDDVVHVLFDFWCGCKGLFA